MYCIIGNYMTNHIDKILNDIIEREGGFVNHPADKGGPTKYGITTSTLMHYWTYKYNRTATPTIEDIKNLTETEARDIYLAMYIESPAFDVLPSIAMQEAIIDAGINHGIGTATKFLQYALNALGEHLTVDGVIGPKTLTAANKYPSDLITTLMLAERAKFYGNILKNQRTQLVFAAGWFNRFGDVLETYAWSSFGKLPKK